MGDTGNFEPCAAAAAFGYVALPAVGLDDPFDNRES